MDKETQATFKGQQMQITDLKDSVTELWDRADRLSRGWVLCFGFLTGAVGSLASTLVHLMLAVKGS